MASPAQESYRGPEDIQVASLPGFSSVFEAARWRRDLERILAGHVEAESIIDALARHPMLAPAFPKQAVREGYSVGEHSLIAIRQFDRLFPELHLPCKINREVFRVFLALHDIGKGFGKFNGDQHKFTLEVFDKLRSLLPIDDRQFKILKVLVGSDAIGRFMQEITGGEPGGHTPSRVDKLILSKKLVAKDLNSEDMRLFHCNVDTLGDLVVSQGVDYAAQQVMKLAKEADVSPPEFLRLNVLFFQTDTTSYSLDGRRSIERSALSEFVDLSVLGEDPETIPAHKIASDGNLTFNYLAHLNTKLRSWESQSNLRAYPSLDFLYEREDLDWENGEVPNKPLFKYHPGGMRLLFSPELEQPYLQLENTIENS